MLNLKPLLISLNTSTSILYSTLLIYSDDFGFVRCSNHGRSDESWLRYPPIRTGFMSNKCINCACHLPEIQGFGGEEPVWNNRTTTKETDVSLDSFDV